MKITIKKPQAKCQYCGKTYTKNHGNQKYCSYNCKTNAKKEQVARARMKHYYTYKNTSKESLGSGSLGPHKHTDDTLEYEKIQNELKRLRLKNF